MVRPRRVTATSARREMRAAANAARAKALQRYFKTAPGEYAAGDRFLGLTVPVVRRIARAHRDLPLGEVATLLNSPWHEERLLALVVLVAQYDGAQPAMRDAIFRFYLKNTGRINNWDLVDCSAGRIVGAHLYRADRVLLRRLAASDDLWKRRIAVIATSYFISRGEYADTLEIARLLLSDPHDLIHKAVGWMLREVGKRDRGVEERFLREHAARMPRTMLRYAIERFPKRLRLRYLAERRTSIP